LVHVGEARPWVIGAHAAIVDGLALGRRQIAVDAHESDIRLGAPDLTVDEADDVAAARLRVDGTPLAVLRIDPLVGLVDLDHVPVAVDHQVESVDHRVLLFGSRRSCVARTYHGTPRISLEPASIYVIAARPTRRMTNRRPASCAAQPGAIPSELRTRRVLGE